MKSCTQEEGRTFSAVGPLLPAQYRIAIPYLARFISEHLHVRLRNACVGIDLLASWTAVLLLYYLLQRLLLRTNANWQLRLLSNALFAGLVLFYLEWIDFYQNPGTLPSAAFVALTLFLVVQGLGARGGRILQVSR